MGMLITKDRLAGFVFLVIFIWYGLLAGDIASLPGDEYEPVTARTLPQALAVIGALLSIVFLASSLLAPKVKIASDAVKIKLLWKPTLSLLAMMAVYGLVLDWLGFLLSTIFFLVAGIRIMGERRPKVLLGVSIPFVLVLWFGLTQLLEIYLAPGRLFSLLGL